MFIPTEGLLVLAILITSLMAIIAINEWCWYKGKCLSLSTHQSRLTKSIEPLQEIILEKDKIINRQIEELDHCINSKSSNLQSLEEKVLFQLELQNKLIENYSSRHWRRLDDPRKPQQGEWINLLYSGMVTTRVHSIEWCGDWDNIEKANLLAWSTCVPITQNLLTVGPRKYRGKYRS
jgi:hypothetical protein